MTEQPAVPDRHTVDTITSDALDHLYADLDAPRADRMHLHTRAVTAEAELADLRDRLTRIAAIAQKLAAAQHGTNADADSIRRTTARELLAVLGSPPVIPAPIVDREFVSHRTPQDQP